MRLTRLSALLLMLSGPVLAERQSIADVEKPSASPASTEDLELAEKHWKDGQDRYQQGKYELAKIEFWAGYELSHRAEFLFNLSLVSEKLNRIQEAIDLQERYLRERPKSEPLSQEEQARLPHLQALLQPSRPAAPTVQAPLTNSSPMGSSPPKGSIALMATGGGLLIVGLGCGLGAILTANTINSGMAGNDRALLIQRGQALNATAITFDVLGGVALAGGAVWAIVHRVKHPKR